MNKKIQGIIIISVIAIAFSLGIVFEMYMDFTTPKKDVHNYGPGPTPIIVLPTKIHDFNQEMNNTLWKYPEVQDFHEKYENVTFTDSFRPSYGGNAEDVESFLYESRVSEIRGNETLHKVELAVLLYENRTEFSIREYVILNETSISYEEEGFFGFNDMIVETIDQKQIP